MSGGRRRSISAERRRSGSRARSPKVKKEYDSDEKPSKRRNPSPPEKKRRRWDRAEGDRHAARSDVKLEDDGSAAATFGS